MDITDAKPSAKLYDIEIQAHVQPWSECVFMQSQGAGYRWRQLKDSNGTKGFTVCQQIADEVTLHNIAVLPKEQGRGYGRLLLTDVLDYAQQHQLTAFLEVRQSNRAAIALYESAGFKQVGRRPDYYRCHEHHEDALVMRWQPIAYTAFNRDN